MLKKRLTALVVVKGGIVVQSISFNRYLPVGSIDVTVEFLSKWGIDEIVVLDIDVSKYNRSPDFEMVERVSSRAFVPLTIGGGIRTLEDIRKLVHAGADKVSINTAALKTPIFIQQAAEVFGNQCIVVAMDVRQSSEGNYEVCLNSGKTPTGRNAVEWAVEVERLGAGEILVNSINRDGMKNGYDIKLLEQIVSAVSVPVIACGGVGNISHFNEGITAGASAVAAGNYFHFTEHSPIVAKANLVAQGLDIRLDTHANYAGQEIEKITGRIAKRDDAFLNKLRFEIQRDEIV
jgi:cyclase